MARTYNSTLFVENLSQALIFDMEISGQISDGKWENSRPHDHWTWVCHTNIEISPDKLGYDRVYHRRKYGVSGLYNEFMKDVREGEFPWPNRMIFYGRFGKIMDPKYFDESSEMRHFIETIGFNENINTLEDLKNGMKDWELRYWKDNYDEVFSTENIQKFRNENYGVKELKKDLKALNTAINTPIY